MRSYLDLVDDILCNGEETDDRTGVGTLQLFGAQYVHDLADGFPLLTTKKVHVRSIIWELLWILAGRTDNAWLNDRGVTIWDEWADESHTATFGREPGDLGPVYGHQWRNWGGAPFSPGVDQIASVIDQIRTNPTSRRLIVTAWNPIDADQVTLPPCHTLFQFHVTRTGRLDCQLYQRSADVFLGVPFNLASYALLTHMVAQVCGLEPGRFVHTFGNVHLYRNHIDAARLQLSRPQRELPRLVLDPTVTSIDEFDFDHIRIDGYDPHPPIRAQVAI